MQNTFTCSDGHIINFDDQRPRATRKQVEELKQHPAIYKIFCERVNAYNRSRYKAQTADPAHKTRIQEQRKEWRRSDAGKKSLATYARKYHARLPQSRLSIGIKKTIHQALQDGWGISTAEHYLGCSLKEYRKYIESKFREGMSWDNYGRGAGRWCIDHVKPIAFFNLTEPEELKQCFRWTNTQPLWNQDNLAKWHEDRLVSEDTSPSSPSSAPASPS